MVIFLNLENFAKIEQNIYKIYQNEAINEK